MFGLVPASHCPYCCVGWSSTWGPACPAGTAGRVDRPMVFYFVQRGETLYHIAQRYQTTVHAIVAANRLEDPNAICPGQALMIPKPGEVPSPPPGGIVHLVRPGETIFHLARKFGSTVPEIMRANQVAHPDFTHWRDRARCCGLPCAPWRRPGLWPALPPSDRPVPAGRPVPPCWPTCMCAA